MQQSARLYHLFRQYKAGTSSPEQRKALMDMVGDPDNEQLVKALIKGEVAELGQEVDKIEALICKERASVLLAGILERGKIDEMLYFSRATARWSTWKRWAAAIVITSLLAVGVWAYNNYYRAYHTYVSGKEDNKVFLLPDGSTVTLSRNSELQLADNFGKRSREMELKGEGFFEVEHDASKAFIVRTSSMAIHDLGTAFHVRAYPHEQADIASLAEGMMNITLRSKDRKAPVIYSLAPMQRLTVAKKGMIVRIDSCKAVF